MEKKTAKQKWVNKVSEGYYSPLMEGGEREKKKVIVSIYYLYFHKYSPLHTNYIIGFNTVTALLH
jgi:hypothetical protein